LVDLPDEDDDDDDDDNNDDDDDDDEDFVTGENNDVDADPPRFC
jgi:hypothetical protein